MANKFLMIFGIKKLFSVLNLIDIISSPLTAIAVTETWLTAETESSYSIPGYKFIAKPRIGKLGGGVGIFINSDFHYTVHLDLCRMSVFVECLFIEIPQKGKLNILIGCVYRPPNTDVNLFNSEILTILKLIDSEKNKLVLLAGDYNLDLLKYDCHSPTAEFLNNMLSYYFLPVIRNPTRISEISATLIDNIFINQTQYETKSAIVYNDISDHLPIALHLKTSIIKPLLPNII